MLMLRGGNSMTGRVSMKAAAAARTWWAALRRRSRRPMRLPGSSALRVVASHASAYVLLALAVVMIVCAVAGFAVTLREDSHLATERHEAMQRAVDELQGAAGDLDHIDDAKIQFIARRTGLQDIRFDTDDEGIIITAEARQAA